MDYVYDEMGGFGSFGSITWDTVLAPAGYRASDNTWTKPSDWITRLLGILIRNRAPSAADPSADPNWPRGLDCYGLARSLGLSSEATGLCYRLGPVWPDVLAYAESQAALAEIEKWEGAECVDRAVVDGGGAVCTAADGSTRVTCYHTDGSDPTILASGPCPGGTGGMPRGAVSITARRPSKQMTSSVGTGKPVLQGRVVDADGAPVSGASVRLTSVGGSMGAALKSSTTDASGMFSMQPSAGTYDLVVGASGFKNVRFSPITVTSSGTTTTADLVLEATAAVGGEPPDGGNIAPDGGDSGLPPPPVCPEGSAPDPVTGECVVVPVGCPEGRVLDTLTGNCVDIASACPEGQMLDVATGTCVPVPGTSKPWYQSPWVWVAGGAAVIGTAAFFLLRGKGGSGSKEEE